MKKVILIIITIIICISCDNLFAPFEEYGMDVRVKNRSNSDIEWAKVYIGKYDKDVFYPTDSLVRKSPIPQDTIGVNLTPESEYKWGWKPSRKKLNTDVYGFLLKLSDGREHYFSKSTGRYKTESSIGIGVYDDKILPPYSYEGLE